jgi:hypothetical protein
MLLGAATLTAGLYALYLAAAIYAVGLFNYVGLDFRAYWASAAIARDLGVAAVFDPPTQERYQHAFYADAARPPAVYEVFPLPYLPAFVLILLPFGLLPPVPGYAAWVLATLALVAVYTWRIARQAGAARPWQPLAMGLVCLPTFAAVLTGQLDALLLVALGEVLLAVLRGAPGRAGAWLAGLLLKPHMLALLAPWVLLTWQRRCLAGLIAGGAGVLGVSLAVAGLDGLLALARLLAQLFGGVATNYPESMMNWRALALNLGWVVPPGLAWGVALAGMAATGALAVAAGRAAAPLTPDRTVVAVLGLYAATAALVWHAHVYTALPLLLPLAYLHARGQAPRWLLPVWALGPAWVFLAAGFADGSRTAHHLAGLTMLGANVALTAWAWRALRRPAVLPRG